MLNREKIDPQIELLKLKSASIDHVTGVPLVNIVYKDLIRHLDRKGKIGFVTVAVLNGEELEVNLSFSTYDKIIQEITKSIQNTLNTHKFSRAFLTLPSSGSEIFYIFILDDLNEPLGREDFEGFIRNLENRLSAEIDKMKNELTLKGVSPRLYVTGRILESKGIWRSDRFLARSFLETFHEIENARENIDIDLKGKIESIIKDRKIEVVFQPIVFVKEKAIFGFEALSRGTLPDLENPENLLTLAQRFEMLKDLEAACVFNALHEFYRAIQKNSKYAEKKLFINLSPLSFTVLISDEFIESIQKYGFKPGQIVIELTEKFSPQDPMETKDYYDLIKRIAKHVGFEIAVDDVGSGYSTLERIAELNPAYLKYDKALTKNTYKDPVKQELLKTVFEFSKKIGAKLIVEGVDNMQDYDFLLKLGIEYIQGFIFSKPLKLVK